MNRSAPLPQTVEAAAGSFVAFSAGAQLAGAFHVRVMDQKYAELIDVIYAATTDPSGWRGCLDRIAQAFNGVAALRIASGPELGDLRSAEATLDPDFLGRYYEYYAAFDPMSARDRSGRTPPVVVEEALISMSDLVRTEFHADWMRPQGLDRTMRWRVEAPSGVTDLILLRPERLGAFSDDEQALSHALLPHLRRAVEISSRLDGLGGQDAASLEAFERLGAGIFLVDARRRVRFSNRVGERLLAEGDGLAVSGGRLHALGLDEQRFARAIADATGGGLQASGRTGALMAIHRVRGDGLLSASISPYPETRRSIFDAGPLAMVIVSAPERKAAVSAQAVRELYDLTPAEARLVHALCEGVSLADYARSNAVALSTVKTHLAAVFSKTGATRQSHLVLRIMTDPALVLAT